jgi:hypothetical protein
MDIRSLTIGNMDYIDRNHKAFIEFLYLCCDRFDNFALPIKPNNKFDVIGICESDSKICNRIRIICTETKNASGSYVVNLLKSGGYEDSKEKKSHFDSSSCDYVFASTPEDAYLIPSASITQKKALTLSMFEEFKINE